MCHTAVTCQEISTESIDRHVRELNSPANHPCVATQLHHTDTNALFALHHFGEQSQNNYNPFVGPFLFRTNFLLVIVNFIRTTRDVFI